MLRISEERRIVALKRIMVISFIAMAGSIAAFVPVFNAARVSIYESGFMSSFSLIFSDLGAVFTYWQSFSLSILETFPVVEVAGVLFTVLVFYVSINFMIISFEHINRSLSVGHRLNLNK